MSEKIWSDEAWEDYLYWQLQDKKTLKRINQLIKDIERNGCLEGIGNLLLCLFDVHKISPLSILLYPLTNIISLPSPALLSALPKKFSAVCHPRKKQIPSDNLSVFSDILHTRP